MNDKAILESLLFVSNEPLSAEQLKEVLKGISMDKVAKLIDELNLEYKKNERSFLIEEIAGGWQMRTVPECAPWIKKLLNVQHRERLSGPALETLAIIAYKQPITKVEIEGIRGVNVDYIVNSLLERGLIRIVGKKDVIGKPFMYGTSPAFLRHFGLSDIKELPEVEFRRAQGDIMSHLNVNTQEDVAVETCEKDTDSNSGEQQDLNNKPGGADGSESEQIAQ